MPVAFVLINTEIGAEEDVVKELRKIEGVEEAYTVYGVYDIVAKIRANSQDRLNEIVVRRIRLLNKVRTTSTMMVIEAKEGGA